MKWLDDRPNLDKMSISIKERNKKGNNTGFSLTFSKSFKDYIVHSEMSHIRFGFDKSSTNPSVFNMIIQLNNEDIGVPIYNDKEQVRLWFEIGDYMSQYNRRGVIIPMDVDLPVSIKKSGILEVDLSNDL